MTTQTAGNGAIESESAGPRMELENPPAPGTYVCESTGRLFRIPEEEVSAGCSPLTGIIGAETIRMTKISDNPYVTLSKARLLASNLDLDVNF